MGLLRALSEKPWVPEQGMTDNLHGGISFSLPAAKVGLRVFLSVVTILFLMLIMAYGERMATEEWRAPPPRARGGGGARLSPDPARSRVASAVGLHWY
jgi:cytochrome c oxidase subunit III